MVTTRHRYIDQNPYKTTDRYLILGTIHPHRTENFVVDFFYGNRNSLWEILSSAFPIKKFNCVENIRQTLSDHKVWVSDAIQQCSRSDEYVTRDDLLFDITPNKELLAEGIKKSSIDTIYFTSAFGKNNAAKLFTEIFGINSQNNFDKRSRQFIIEERYFGRRITGILLFSPSGQANRGVANSLAYKAVKNQYASNQHPISRFRIDFYLNKFQRVFG